MIIIIILTLIPIVIWTTMMPLGIRFYDLPTAMTSIGQILGLVGMTFYSINLILTRRFKIIDKYFKGLDKVYAKHHSLGTIAFSMLLFHPLFLVVKYLYVSLYDAALFFVPFINLPITLGIISLLLMIVLLVMTFYIKLKYHVWKISHKFMTIAFIFAILHSAYIPSDISRNIILRYYILILAMIGLTLSFYQAFLTNFWTKKLLKYKVKKIRVLNREIIEIELYPVKKRLIFKPGQFVFVSFGDKNIGKESHPFSITSRKDETNFKLIIKNLGDFTSKLEYLKPESKVLVEGPYGNFSYKNVKNKNQIWVAGGIGITPFLSMARTLEIDYCVDLYYCVNNKSEAVMLDELEKIAQNNKNFKIILWLTKEDAKGFITADIIESQSKELKNKGIFLCGPLKFMENLEKQFLLKGIDKNKIHYENFSF